MSSDIEIQSFEPVPETCSELHEIYGGDDRIHLDQIPLSNKSGVAQFTIGHNTGNPFAKDDFKNLRSTEVKMATGDDYCLENNIEVIDFPKIDAAGYDMKVLSGFGGMLADGKIRYSQIECTSNVDNRYHHHMGNILSFLAPYDISLHSLAETKFKDNSNGVSYNQVWFRNAIFARQKEMPTL